MTENDLIKIASLIFYNIAKYNGTTAGDDMIIRGSIKKSKEILSKIDNQLNEQNI